MHSLNRTLANVSTRLGFAIYATEEDLRHENLQALCTNPEQLSEVNPWAVGVRIALFIIFINLMRIYVRLSRRKFIQTM